MVVKRLMGILTAALGGAGAVTGIGGAVATEGELWTLVLAAVGVGLIAAGRFLLSHAGVSEPESEGGDL